MDKSTKKIDLKPTDKDNIFDNPDNYFHVGFFATNIYMLIKGVPG